MRTTLNLDEELLREATELTGITKKTELVHAGLKSLIAREAARRLAALGGSMPNLKMPHRRRSLVGEWWLSKSERASPAQPASSAAAKARRQRERAAGL